VWCLIVDDSIKTSEKTAIKFRLNAGMLVFIQLVKLRNDILWEYDNCHFMNFLLVYIKVYKGHN